MNETRLTKSDLKAIEAEVELLIGAPPTIEDLQTDGYTEREWLIATVDFIGGLGKVATLIVAELIQSFGAIVIAVVFAMMEFQRVQAGAVALGQVDDKASLIAFAVVTANVVHPIYSLRQLRGQDKIEHTIMTGRGYLEAFKHRLKGQPVTKELDLYHNPTLHHAATVITWSTIILAVYDILSPLVTQIATNTLTRPVPLAIMEFVMGLGLSVAGVFFLQSASHEIGVRILTDQPQRLSDELAKRQRDYDQKVEAVRADVRTRFMQAKLLDKARKDGDIPPNPFGHTAHAQDESANGLMTGNANGHGITVTSMNANGKI